MGESFSGSEKNDMVYCKRIMLTAVLGMFGAKALHEGSTTFRVAPAIIQIRYLANLEVAISQRLQNRFEIFSFIFFLPHSEN